MLITCTDDNVIPLIRRLSSHKASVFERNVLEHLGKDEIIFVTTSRGDIQKISLPDKEWSYYGCLPQKFKKGTYAFLNIKPEYESQIALAFALGSYHFDRYSSKTPQQGPFLLVSKETYHAVQPIVDALYLVRDLINQPANHMGPADLANVAKRMAEQYKGDYRCVMGEDLAKAYPLIHLVGRGAEADRAPRFVTMSFKQKHAAKTVALVGKGVCFDSGGLNIKPDSGMLLMKKDMGGAAQILGLAQLLLAKDTPINLAVYLPLVDNAVDGKSMRPLDIVRSRSGKTVEVGHTDAEGRLILADTLTQACEDQPDLLIDCATLTGAARIALGPEVPAFFTNISWIARELYECSERMDDPLWQMPLYQPYKESLKAMHVDLKNVANHGYAGAIIGALFLEEFVDPNIPWLHLDFMGWNPRSRPSFPEGGDAQGLRALYELILSFTHKDSHSDRLSAKRQTKLRLKPNS